MKPVAAYAVIMTIILSIMSRFLLLFSRDRSFIND